MTDEDTIELGHYCEDLLSQDYFNVVVQQFNGQCFAHFMSAETPQKREETYSRFNGGQDFLAHLAAFVEQKDSALQRIAALSEQDAHIEGID